MNIPIPNTDQFLYTPPTPDPGGVDRFVKNLAALQDPSGTLARLQAEEVAKATADIKMEDIDAQYQRLALKSLQDYQQNRMNMYKGNKKFSRLKLSGEQILEDQLAYKRMLMDINTLKQTSQENAQTMQEVYKMYASQVLTPEEYSEFEKRRQEADAKATDIGSVPRYRNILNNYLQTKPQRVTADQTKWIYKTPEQLSFVFNKAQVGQTAFKPDVSTKQIGFIIGSPIWNNEIRPMMQKFGIFTPGMDLTAEAQAMHKYNESQFNPKEYAPSSTNIYNSAGGKDRFKPLEQKVGNITYYDFGAKPVKDTYDQFSGEYSTIMVEPSGKAWVYMRQVVNSKGEPIDVNDEKVLGSNYFKNTGAKKDPNKNGGVWLPYNDKVKWSLQTNNFDTDGIKATPGTYTPPPGQPTPGTTTQSTVLPGYENVWPAGKNNARYIYNGYPYSYEEISQALEANGGSVSVAMSNGTVTVELPKK